MPSDLPTPHDLRSSPSLVAQQGERQVVLVGELHVRLDGVAADADHGRTGVGEVLVVVAERAGLGGAARRVVGRVEVDDDPVAALVAQLDGVAGLRRAARSRARRRPPGVSWLVQRQARPGRIPGQRSRRCRPAVSRPAGELRLAAMVRIAVVNQKGGVGKTTVALGLASAAAAGRPPGAGRRPRPAGQRQHRPRRLGTGPDRRPRPRGRPPGQPARGRHRLRVARHRRRHGPRRRGQLAAAGPARAAAGQRPHRRPGPAAGRHRGRSTTTWCSSTARRRSACSP